MIEQVVVARRQIAENEGIDVPRDVLSLLAWYGGPLRHLHGILIRLIALSSLSATPMTPSLLVHVVENLANAMEVVA
jgi:hypothetical protein